MRTPHLTERAHYNIIKKRVAPAIDHAYNKMQQNVLKVVVANAEKTGKINVAGDAMYDSPGFSAMSIGNITFSKFKKCNHGKLKKVPGKYLDLRNEADKFAFDSLFELTATQKRLEDMTMVSPHWATSEVEAFNSVSLLYHPKSRFFSFYGFRMRMQLSVLHWNSLKLEKLDGDRQVIGKKSHYSKTHKKLVWKDVFTKGTMNWRNEIYDSLQRGDRDDQLSSVLDDANEAFDLELEEIAFDDFAFEFEAEDIDTELESDDDNETEDVENDEGGLRDDGDLKIDMNEKKSLMKDWSTLVVGIEDRILQFPLKKKKDASELCGLNFSSGFTSHPDSVKMLKCCCNLKITE
ncbi:unnamed protein product [Caenorhabditis brenneri]